MNEHWDGDIHYYDYSPGDRKLYTGRDAYVVAEAYVWIDKIAHGVVFVVSAQDLRSGVTFERAIESASKRARELADEFLRQSQKSTKDTTDLFNWNGQHVARVLP